MNLAVEAFFLNDPYHSHPLGAVASDRELWQVFHARYLDRSREILAGEHVEGVKVLPERFLESVVKKQRERLVSRGGGNGGSM